MLSALLLALREGVEAALVVGIVLVYLNRTGRRALTAYVWWGVALAAGSSAAAAALLQRWQVSEDGFEGLLMLAAGALVVTMIVWMNRVARHLRKEIEQRVEGLAQRESRAAGWGLGLFVFLMVLREGAELVLILRAVELSSAGVEVWIGTALGLALAVAVGLFFFQGTLRIPLGRFFAATSTILMVVAFQLGLTGLHELSEALWLPSSKREMALIGPIVRNEVFFFAVILGVAGLVALREWFALPARAAGGTASNPAERRRQDWEQRKQRRWSFAAALLCLAVVLSLAGEFVYARAAAAPADARPLTPQGSVVRIPLTDLADSNLHFYQVDAGGAVIRFVVIHKRNGDYGAALDACQICGRAGYRQEGSNIICRNCAAAIYIPSIGESGGCNPIGVKSRVEGADVVVDLGALADATALIHN
ncbi:MAG TPA: Fe-S-containing protein [Candidatus Acidoferrales bacterium]|jgi:FTR1 family protein|nr:Fe-S-containing protein [Candidatus Acidoferrales bacterium]